MLLNFFGGGRRGGGNLNGSGEKSKAAKKGRSKKRELARKGLSEKELHCSDELLGWDRGGTLYTELRARNTAQLKDVCIENGIPRSGAKYEIVANITAHVEGYKRQKEVQQTQSAAKKGDLGASYKLKLSGIKSFDAVVNAAKKLIAKDVAKQESIMSKFEVIHGVTCGVDDAILIAVTGPNAGQYNGKWGEGAVDAKDWIASVYLDFFTENAETMTVQEVEHFCTKLAAKHENEAYGYDPVLYKVGKKIADLWGNDDERKEVVMHFVDPKWTNNSASSPKKLKLGLEEEEISP